MTNKSILLVVATIAILAYMHNSKVERYDTCFNILMEVRGIEYPTSMDSYKASFVCGERGIFTFS